MSKQDEQIEALYNAISTLLAGIAEEPMFTEDVNSRAAGVLNELSAEMARIEEESSRATNFSTNNTSDIGQAELDHSWGTND